MITNKDLTPLAKEAIRVLLKLAMETEDKEQRNKYIQVSLEGIELI